MKNLTRYLLLTLCLISSIALQAQALKKTVSDDEIQYLERLFVEISKTDQKYRGYIGDGTQDDAIIAAMDSVYEADGIEAYMAYKRSLNLSLPKQVEDSLWALQHQLDFHNHLAMRGIWETYGYIPKEVIEEKNYVQVLLLVHPPKDWDVARYHTTYADLLRPEVDAGRMPGKTYATFYDNVLCKIMKKPQLYGTNQEFDASQGKVLPPIIEDLEASNQARKEIGLPLLQEGEYRLPN